MTEPTTTTDRRVFGHYWRNQAIVRQGIIDKLDRRVAEMSATIMLHERDAAAQAQTIKELAASVVQLENDYDAVEEDLARYQPGPLKPEPVPSSGTSRAKFGPLKTSRQW